MVPEADTSHLGRIQPFIADLAYSAVGFADERRTGFNGCPRTGRDRGVLGGELRQVHVVAKCSCHSSAAASMLFFGGKIAEGGDCE